MRGLGGSRRFSAVACKPLKTFRLAGCLAGSSPVRSVVCNLLLSLDSAVLGGSPPEPPIPPIALAGALGRCLGLTGRNPQPIPPEARGQTMGEAKRKARRLSSVLWATPHHPSLSCQSVTHATASALRKPCGVFKRRSASTACKKATHD